MTEGIERGKKYVTSRAELRYYVCGRGSQRGIFGSKYGENFHSSTLGLFYATRTQSFDRYQRTATHFDYTVDCVCPVISLLEPLFSVIKSHQAVQQLTRVCESIWFNRWKKLI
jgi:hypothetical protein